MLFNGRALIFTFSGTQVRIAVIERLQSMHLVSTKDFRSGADAVSLLKLPVNTDPRSITSDSK